MLRLPSRDGGGCLPFFVILGSLLAVGFLVGVEQVLLDPNEVLLWRHEPALCDLLVVGGLGNSSVLGVIDLL